MRADLHVHSTASDGTLSPSQLVELALEASVDVLAIADHDSVQGISSAARMARSTPLTLIPAVELSAVVDDGRDVHLLGYFIDPDHPDLRQALKDLRDARHRRAVSMVTALNGAGYAVSIDEVLRISDGGAVGRSHVARAMVTAGHVDSVSDAFARFIGRGRPFYVAKDVRSPETAIARIHEAGGVAVVAHPGVSGVEDLLGEMIASGLDGIEAYHADHTPDQRAHFHALAVEYGLLVTGGSDFHGTEAPNAALGSVDIPTEEIERLLAVKEAR